MACEKKAEKTRELFPNFKVHLEEWQSVLFFDGASKNSPNTAGIGGSTISKKIGILGKPGSDLQQCRREGSVQGDKIIYGQKHLEGQNLKIFIVDY
eukprot:Gb_09838 [translate_table: standard]